MTPCGERARRSRGASRGGLASSSPLAAVGVRRRADAGADADLHLDLRRAAADRAHAADRAGHRGRHRARPVARREDRQPRRRPPAGRASSTPTSSSRSSSRAASPATSRSGSRTSPPRSARSARSGRWIRTSSRRSAASSPTRAASSDSSQAHEGTPSLQRDPRAGRHRGRDVPHQHQDAPHNVLVRAPELIAKHADIVAPAQQFAFAPDAAASTAVRGGHADATIALRFGAPSTPSWTSRCRIRAVPALAGRRGRPGHRGRPAQRGERDRRAGPDRQRRRRPEDRADRLGRGLGLVRRVDRPRDLVEGIAAPTPIRLVDDTGTVIRLAPGQQLDRAGAAVGRRAVRGGSRR